MSLICKKVDNATFLQIRLNSCLPGRDFILRIRKTYEKIGPITFRRAFPQSEIRFSIQKRPRSIWGTAFSISKIKPPGKTGRIHLMCTGKRNSG